MAEVQALHGIRYDLGHVGSLSSVVCPPYDVIDAALHDRLYKLHPANVVRIELNREEPGDDATRSKYARAARFLSQWLHEGVLRRDAAPAVYVYHQEFTTESGRFTRRGFISRVRLERFGEGQIFPHEETLAGPKQDRLLLTRACRANISQIFGLYPDETNEAQELLERAVAGQPAIEAQDHLGVSHRMWPVTDVATLTALSKAMGPKPIFIADGHHRYETACNYRDELAAAGPLDRNHPANYVLMTSISMSDPGLLVLPTHRLFRGLPPMTSEQLKARLGDCFATRVAGEGTDLAARVWDEIETEGRQGTLGLYTNQDERWTLARLTPQGAARLAELAPEHSPEWRELGVSVLHRLLVDTLLGARELPKPKYVHSVQEVIDSLNQGDIAGRDATGVVSAGGQFELAALVMPATVDHIRQISTSGERMPAKSTYFYPKLLTGLVINPLE